MLINIHSHLPAKDHVWTIHNLKQPSELQDDHLIYSSGLHPWFLKAQSWQDDLNLLKTISIKKNIIAIGECGLDRVCSTNFALQKEVFVAQIHWANKINKPLILHCVRAHEEMLQLLKVNQCRVPVIFHGFNKNKSLAGKILRAGHWLSFGKDLFKPTVAAIFKTIPHNRFFLETDDSEISIQSIYDLAAFLKNISTEVLILQILQNRHTVFKI